MRALGLAAILSGAGMLRAAEPASGLPAVTPDQGLIVVEVVYDDAGRVLYCRVNRSTAPRAVENFTADFIKRNWGNSLFAGQTEIFPITFQLSPLMSPDWNVDLPPPPGLRSSADAEKSLKLRLSFGKDGWISDAQVLEPSGSDALDNETVTWVKVHWHHQAYANQVIDAPFKFEPPVAPPPPAPPPPPKPPPLGTPANPIPAERAE